MTESLQVAGKVWAVARMRRLELISEW